MNWANLMNLIDTVAIGTVTLGAIPIVLKAIGLVQVIRSADEQPEEPEPQVQIGQRVTMVIEDQMACEKYELLEDRMELIEKQILIQRRLIKQMYEQLDSEFNYDRASKLELAIINAELKVNKLKGETDKIMQEMEKIMFQYGTLIAVSDS